MVIDASTLVTPAVIAAIDALALTDADAAAIRLARLYAKQIDDALVGGDPKITAWTVRWIGPELLKALEALGATPAARAALARKGGPAEGGESKLAGLRAVAGKGKPA